MDVRGKIWGLGVLAGLCLWAGFSHAQTSPQDLPHFSVIDFQNIQSGGNGCAGGQAIDIYYGERSQRLMIFFPELRVDLKAKSFERKSCAVSIPVNLPEGQRLVIAQPAIFGASQLWEGTTVKAQAEVFVVGAQGPLVSEDLNHGDSHYFYRRSHDEVRTECGAKTLVRANVNLLGQGSSGSEGRALLEGVAVTLKVEDCLETL